MNLFLRILQNKIPAVRKFEFSALYTHLQLLVLPQECVHVFLERYFERPVPEGEGGDGEDDDDDDDDDDVLMR